MILLISAARGRGHGAERMLAGLLEGWPDAASTFALLAPRDAEVFGVAQRLGVSVTALDVRGTVAGNLAAVRDVLPRLPACRVVHGWTAITFELAAAVAAARGIPFTATLHDHPQAGYFSLGRRWLMRMIVTHARAIVCVSGAVHRACQRAGYSGPLVVIRNGLRVLPVPAPSGWRGRIGFLGMQHAHKGFSIVSDWARRLTGPVSFQVYGRRNMTSLAGGAEVSGGGRIHHRGPMAPEKIFEEIDAVVHPSLIFDSFPTVLLEAARAGVPAIASDVGGAGEIIEHGTTGLLFKADAPEQGFSQLQRLLADEAAGRAMGAAARQRFLREFTLERMIADYRALWESL